MHVGVSGSSAFLNPNDGPDVQGWAPSIFIETTKTLFCSSWGLIPEISAVGRKWEPFYLHPSTNPKLPEAPVETGKQDWREQESKRDSLKNCCYD